MDEWIKEIWYGWIYNGVYSVFKKKEILPFVTTWIKLKYTVVSKISQKEKRQILHNITYMWNLKKERKK